MTATKQPRSSATIRVVGEEEPHPGWERPVRPTRRTVLVVVGTRPEVIKLAPVVRALEHDRELRVELCVVGQQAEILEQALAEWDLVPDHRVVLEGTDRRLPVVLGQMLPQLANIIEHVEPALVMVEGDTTTNLAAALAAFYAQVPVAHVEAGLRSGDVSQPFPEEMHRVLVDQLSSVHYAPTDGARDNIVAENHRNAAEVKVVGNTVVDALLTTLADAGPTPSATDGRRTLLVTAHRRENFGPGMAHICSAVRELATERDDLRVVFVLHTNPAAFEPARALLGDIGNVSLIPPQPYRAFVRLLAAADVILTDSGGIQEEAPYLGRPVIVTRQVTERPEAAAAGAASIVGADTTSIVAAVTAVLDDADLRRAMSRRRAPYGDGRAAQRISADVAQRLLGRPLPVQQVVQPTLNAERRSERRATTITTLVSAEVLS